MLTALERYPIGTVLKLIIPKWFLSYQEVVGIVQGAAVYPDIDHYIVVAYRTPKGKKKTLMYRPGLIDALRSERNAKILWVPPYAKRFRTTGDENPLLSFPEGTRICFNKMTGMIVDGFPPTLKDDDPCGKLIVQPDGAPRNSHCEIGAEQITSYSFPVKIASDFAGFDFRDLDELLQEAIWKKALPQQQCAS